MLTRFAAAIRRTTEISPGSYAIELATDPPPERILVDLIATGARLVSLNPIRETLEDFFVKRVAEAESARTASLEASRARD